ncbi:4-hydroxy-2-oxoglutarate aldolase, mitochondrial, partial [Halocaridina rubra]
MTFFLKTVSYTNKLWRSLPKVGGQRRFIASAANTQQLELGGIFPPIPTPFNDDESIAYDKLALNVAAYNKVPFRGLVIQGSNGEYVYLNSVERVELVKRVREFLPLDSKKLLLAGSGCE